ncbi:MAG: signal peptide peptidase SppA [Deltaproteobacteria bacterium]|jgi:protease-4|nr:signal peptide peptidase SppA [Deltaproteobacteria bacterium]
MIKKITILFSICIFALSCKQIEKNNENEKDSEHKKLTEKSEKKNSMNAKQANKTASKKKLVFLELKNSVSYKKKDSLIEGEVNTLKNWLDRIEMVKDTSGVDKLFLYLSTFEAPFSVQWEIRNTLLRLKKEKNIKIIVFADVLQTKNYLLASMADKLIVNIAGSWSVTGFAMESLFLKDFLEMLGMEADFITMGKFKGAAENLTRNEMSEPLKKSLNSLLDSFYSKYIEINAKSRNLNPVKFSEFMDSAPLTPKDAVEAKLVDASGAMGASLKAAAANREILRLKKEKKKQPSLLNMFKTNKTDDSIAKDHIALLNLEGPINYGEREPKDLFSDENKIFSSTVLENLSEIEKCNKIKGLLIQINSPGGSALASELLWQKIYQIRQKMPVVVSMGNVAASGGYYLAAAANKIVAPPFTITGSIGVVGGKLVVANTYKKLKIHTTVIKRGKNALWTTSSRKFNESERKTIKNSMQATYKLFKNRIKLGREMKLKKIESLAQGRVWSGVQAYKLGLIDELGGFYEAKNILRKAAGVDENVKIVIYPRPKSWFSKISKLFGGGMKSEKYAVVKFINLLIPGFNFSFSSFFYMFEKERVFTMMPFIFKLN